jgi:uncharacterized protein YktA (UPF0223 family)
MRALRKIVFINSANIRYAEIKLDGNVHFIGTQGVGKSTLLRAVLFFYNADKLHLGIPKEMKSFDDFYLPNPNSYIVYEVEHEHRPFTVLVFRSSGRACYRFIDAPFERKWLVDEFGDVTSEYKVINSRLDKNIYMSKLIDRYEMFKEIIYGNYKVAGKEFGNFQLMEAKSYQNIYRSIQNVFLNSRVDADFIKDIIIRSMEEEESNINLAYFRGQVADFEQEYKDISCWYKTNAKGESTVRLQADKVIANYHDLLYQKQQIEELCGELNYAVRDSCERIPLIEENLSKLNSERERQNKLLGEVMEKFEAEKSTLNKQLGVVDDRIKTCKEKKEYYTNIGVDAIIRRCNEEPVLKKQLKSQKERLDDLTRQYNDIASKYKKLVDGVQSELDGFKQLQENRKNEIRNATFFRKEQLMAERDKQKGEIETSFEEKLKVAEDLVDSIKLEKQECEMGLHSLLFFAPYKADIEHLREEKVGLQKDEVRLAGEIKSLDANLKQLQTEYEAKIKAIESEAKAMLERKVQETADAEEKIAELDKLLESTKGSFYEWLDGSVSGWEKNIGKIIDEKQVLYRTGLHPAKVDTAGKTLYGVELDLSELPMSVRKPDEIKKEKQSLEGQQKALKNDCANIEKKKEADKESFTKTFTPKMKEKREQRSLCDAQRNSIQGKLKAIDVKMQDLMNKTEEEKKQRKSALDSQMNDVSHRLNDAESVLANTKEDKGKQLKAVLKTYEQSVAKVENEQKTALDEIGTTIKTKQTSCETEILCLQQQELDEMKGKGADTGAVEKCKEIISGIKKELTYIEDNRKLVYKYQSDKEELLDNEEEFKASKKNLQEKLNQLEDKYKLKRLDYDRKIGSLSKDIDDHNEQLQKIEEGLKNADGFICNSDLCPPMLREVPERKTLKTPDEVVLNLTSIIVSRHRKEEQFKQSVVLFKDNFTAKNTFNFRVVLNTVEDYLDFASNLDDFIHNNMIDQYRNRTSERYTEILARVSSEIGSLTKRESEVVKVIQDINKDFDAQKFVKVIRQISIRSKQSSDKMVQLMKRIKEFHDENQFAMGEANLFTTDSRSEVNNKAVDYILDLMKYLKEDISRKSMTLSDLFDLEFRVVENDNDTQWTSKLSHVGSEGTDTLVKAMINIMLINVFKSQVSKKFGDFKVHCMMDEIGKLHPQNVKGILEFANSKNILLINSSPTTYNVSDYRYTYLLDKDSKSRTIVRPLITQK